MVAILYHAEIIEGDKSVHQNSDHYVPLPTFSF